MNTLLLSTVLWCTGAQAQELVDRVAAVVERDVITLSEVYELGAEFIEGRAEIDERERRVAELEVLDELINRTLVDQEVERLELQVTEEELDRSIDDIARQNGINLERLRYEVERSGMSWEAYRSEIEQQLQFMKFNQTVIAPRITVPEDELEALYRQRYVDSAAEGPRQLGAIFWAWSADTTPEERAALALEAAEVKARLDGGEAWLDVVRSVPQSPYAALDGDFGAFERGELLPEMDAIAFSLQVGQVGEPVAVSAGIFLLRVTAELPPEIPTFDEVEQVLLAEVSQVRGEEELALWASQARRRAAVEVRLAPPAP